jgi:hypothetical protein
MGLKCGNTVNYKVEKLSFDTILVLLCHCKLCGLSDTEGSVVDFDASWIVRCICNTSYIMCVLSMMRLALLFI